MHVSLDSERTAGRVPDVATLAKIFRYAQRKTSSVAKSVSALPEGVMVATDVHTPAQPASATTALQQLLSIRIQGSQAQAASSGRMGGTRCSNGGDRHCPPSSTPGDTATQGAHDAMAGPSQTPAWPVCHNSSGARLKRHCPIMGPDANTARRYGGGIGKVTGEQSQSRARVLPEESQSRARVERKQSKSRTLGQGKPATQWTAMKGLGGCDGKRVNGGVNGQPQTRLRRGRSHHQGDARGTEYIPTAPYQLQVNTAWPRVKIMPLRQANPAWGETDGAATSIMAHADPRAFPFEGAPAAVPTTGAVQPQEVRADTNVEDILLSKEMLPLYTHSPHESLQCNLAAAVWGDLRPPTARGVQDAHAALTKKQETSGCGVHQDAATHEQETPGCGVHQNARSATHGLETPGCGVQLQTIVVSAVPNPDAQQARSGVAGAAAKLVPDLRSGETVSRPCRTGQWAPGIGSLGRTAAKERVRACDTTLSFLAYATLLALCAICVVMTPQTRQSPDRQSLFATRNLDPMNRSELLGTLSFSGGSHHAEFMCDNLLSATVDNLSATSLCATANLGLAGQAIESGVHATKSVVHVDALADARVHIVVEGIGIPKMRLGLDKERADNWHTAGVHSTLSCEYLQCSMTPGTPGRIFDPLAAAMELLEMLPPGGNSHHAKVMSDNLSPAGVDYPPAANYCAAADPRLAVPAVESGVHPPESGVHMEESGVRVDASVDVKGMIEGIGIGESPPRECTNNRHTARVHSALSGGYFHCPMMAGTPGCIRSPLVAPTHHSSTGQRILHDQMYPHMMPSGGKDHAIVADGETHVLEAHDAPELRYDVPAYEGETRATHPALAAPEPAVARVEPAPAHQAYIVSDGRIPWTMGTGGYLLNLGHGHRGEFFRSQRRSGKGVDRQTCDSRWVSGCLGALQPYGLWSDSDVSSNDGTKTAQEGKQFMGERFGLTDTGVGETSRSGHRTTTQPSPRSATPLAPTRGVLSYRVSEYVADASSILYKYRLLEK
jgi:hypothetical protein